MWVKLCCENDALTSRLGYCIAYGGNVPEGITLTLAASQAPSRRGSKAHSIMVIDGMVYHGADAYVQTRQGPRIHHAGLSRARWQ